MAKQAELSTSRRSAQEILKKVTDNGRDELARSTHALFLSGIAGGITMGLTGLGVSVVQATLGEGQWQEFAAHLIYPLGFISVIIGRAQLFTENTLYPVVLVLDEPHHIWNMLRLWGTVFSANVLGALIFACLAQLTPALQPAHAEVMLKLGISAIGNTTGFIFWSGVVGGWMIALVAWMVSASHWTIGQVVLVWFLTFVVGIGHFAHCIATSGEILAAVVKGLVPVSTYGHWLLFATMGNIVGGIMIVSLLNYGQVKAGESE